MSQLNPGVCDTLSERAMRREFPEEVEKHEADPYHHRYPRAESYHDLAVRLEPIILELEREQNDLLIIAHESVLRVLYGYLMACNAADIPSLKFPRNEIIEVCGLRGFTLHPDAILSDLRFALLLYLQSESHAFITVILQEADCITLIHRSSRHHTTMRQSASTFRVCRRT